MAKRFIDSNIWTTDEWVKSDPNKKLLAIYLISSSSNIGIFDQSLTLVSMILGFEVTEELLLSLPIGVEKFGSKYWIPKFCYHQYGELKETCPPHKRYIEDLKKENLFDRVSIGYQKGIKTLEEKEEEKDKEKEKDKEAKNQFLELVKDYPKKAGIEKTAINGFLKLSKANRKDFIETYPQILKKANDSVKERGDNQYVIRLSKIINEGWDDFKTDKPKNIILDRFDPNFVDDKSGRGLVI